MEKTKGRDGSDPAQVIDELDHRLKNVLTIMQAFVNQAEREAEDVPGFAADLRARIEAFAISHDQINRSGFDAAPLRELVEIKLRPFGLDSRAELDGPDAHLAASAYTAISMALHELTTNAVKHGALSVPEGRIALAWDITDDGALEMHWRESGGPDVSAPGPDGLGNRILDHVIAEDLGGAIESDFGADGVSVRIRIPAGFVSGSAEIGGDDATAADGGDGDGDVTGLELPEDFKLLVVEDNAVIALDIADIVTRIGAKRVETAASLDEARRLLTDLEPDFVLLDVNLGDETSVDLAAELAGRDASFAFMTGADVDASLPEALASRPILQKPFSDASIRSVLARLAGGD